VYAALGGLCMLMVTCVAAGSQHNSLFLFLVGGITQM
jgi:hypothetical protein